MTQTFTESDLADTLAATADVVVDTDALVRTIKRRARERRRVQLAVAGGATAVLAVGVGVPVALVASGPAGTDPVPTGTATERVFTGECTVESIATPLDVDFGLRIQLHAMDATGRYIVGSYGPPAGPNGEWSNSDGPTGRILPIRWDNGVGRVVPVAGENISNVYATGVNRHGAVVGRLQGPGRDGTIYAGWVSLDGTTWTLLPTPSGFDDVYASGINDRNEIVGSASSSNGTVPVVWSIGGDRWRARVIDVPTGVSGLGMAITDDGLVVGTLRGEPYVWDSDGTARALPLPDGLTWGSVDDASGDWAVGFAPGAGAEVRQVLRWNVRTGEMSVILADTTAVWGAAVNSSGDVVWTHERTYIAGSPEWSTLLVTHDGHQYELPEPAGSEYAVPGGLVALSDDATLIAGSGGELWRC